MHEVTDADYIVGELALVDRLHPHAIVMYAGQSEIKYVYPVRSVVYSSIAVSCSLYNSLNRFFCRGTIYRSLGRLSSDYASKG